VRLDFLADEMSKQESRRLVPLAITIATAMLAPLVVLSYLVITTTDGSSRQEQLSRFNTSGFWSPIPGSQKAFNIGPEGTAFTTDLPSDTQWGRVTFDLFLQRPIRPNLQVVFAESSEAAEAFGTLDLTPQVRGSGRFEITADLDNVAGMFDAEKVQIAIVSPAGANVAAISNVQVESFSFSQRCVQVWSRLFEHQPLKFRTINEIDSSRIAGRGVTVLFWAGFFLSMVVLLVRRFLLRRTMSLLTHTAVTIIVLVVLADLRNSVDYVHNAREAVTLRNASTTFTEYVTDLESRLTSFGPMIEFLNKNVAPGQPYLFDVRDADMGTLKSTLTRIAYYAMPARRTYDEDEADFVLLWRRPQARIDHFQQSNEWTRREYLPGDVLVFERNK